MATNKFSTDKVFCGIDFGTSNSCIGLTRGENSSLIPLETGKPIIPSAIFYDDNTDAIRFGHSAVAAYVEQEDGRLLRGMKSILGTSLIKEDTFIRSRAVPFTTILGHYFDFMRRQLSTAAGQDITEVVLGRPVRFVDDDDKADAEAQDSLEEIARAQGFKSIAFQYEPIAAALRYEQQVTKEELVLVADVGGGTSDFSLIRLSPDRAAKIDRQNDILAKNGIHIGGTDFDSLLSLDAVMPAFGLGTLVGAKKLAMPSSYYNDLASWHRINALYKRATVTEIKQVRRDAFRKDLVDRLLAIIEYKLGHLLAIEVERSKIAMSTAPESVIDFHCPPDQLSIPVNRNHFNETIGDTIAKFGASLTETTKLAGVPETEVTTIFVTGGSISIPVLQDCVTAAFPNANFVMGDLLGSVGVGLSLDAKRRFQ